MWDAEMHNVKTRGTLAWVSASFSFLAGLNAFNALMLLTLNGSDFVVEFFIFNQTLGTLGVFLYFWISIIAASAFLGSTFFYLYHGLPADPDMLQRLAKVEASSTLNTNMLENMQIGFFTRLENSEKATETALQKVNMSLEDSEKVTELALQKVNTGLEETRTTTRDALEIQQQLLKSIQRENKKNIRVVKKQATELAGVGKQVKRIEKELTPVKTKVTSKSKLVTVEGVKPRLAEGMRNIGIKNVGQFLTTDPAVIAEKTNEPHETVTNLQAQTQLLMVPGIDMKDAVLLVKAGITSRKELAEQDPVQLSRVIVNMANNHLDKGKISVSHTPTVDDVWSWIRSARH